MATFTLRPLYPWGMSPMAHWIEGWVGLKAGMDAVEEKKKTLSSVKNRTLPIQPVARRDTD
jgi:hypothetical protein